MENFSLTKNTKHDKTNVLFLDFHGSETEDETKEIHTIRGNYIVSKQDNKRVGKIEKTGNKSTFFIKTIRFGPNGDVLANPFENNVSSAYADDNSRAKSYEYTMVTKDTYDIYKKFLYTKNTSYYINIVRRLMNGEA